MIRLGLCCIFREEPIRFRTTTAAALARLPRDAQLAKLAGLARDNADALGAALTFCARTGIGAFRVLSQILPLRTHPTAGYVPLDLPDGAGIVGRYRACGAFARERGIRLAFHPDQFVVLSSPREEVVASSLAEIEHHAEVAEWIGADVITIHGGGAYGDKPAALARLRTNLARLSRGARARIALENDDITYTPADLLPLCESERVPLVYDAHHHRCLPDGASVAATTDRALATWDREPLFHISSPREGWKSPNPRYHHDYVSLRDVPARWRQIARAATITVEVEAKAKELAVLRLARALGGMNEHAACDVEQNAATKAKRPTPAKKRATAAGATSAAHGAGAKAARTQESRKV